MLNIKKYNEKYRNGETNGECLLKMCRGHWHNNYLKATLKIKKMYAYVQGSFP